MSNFMYPDMSGAEPMEHSTRCRTNCEHAGTWQRNEDAALEQVRNLAISATWWDVPFKPETCAAVKRELEAVLGLLECPEGHDDHECSCEDDVDG